MEEQAQIENHYRFEILTKNSNDEDLENFDCGYKNLNTFLTKEAIDYKPWKFGTTTLVYDGEELVGYFTLRNTSLIFNPSGKTGDNRCLPSIEIFRLAVSKYRQNKGIGAYIIKKIIALSYTYSNNFSLIVAILVNSDKDSEKFYTDNLFDKKFGEYITCLKEPYNGNECVPLLMRL